MRRPFIAGNWKMNLQRASASALAKELAKATADIKDVDIAVCPPSVYLEAVSAVVKGSRVGLGAQNMYFAEKGAFTGEISAGMLVDVGCRYVILGHSERRHILGETDELVNKKVKAALKAGLTPIVCVGETLPQRESGQTLEVIRSQFNGSLASLDDAEMSRVVVAYEPVWAIGTGRNATPQQADEVHLDLRNIMESCYNSKTAETVRIQYGGSVTPENAVELLAQPNIDGALVGGASLKVDSFMGIIAGAQNN